MILEPLLHCSDCILFKNTNNKCIVKKIVAVVFTLNVFFLRRNERYIVRIARASGKIARKIPHTGGRNGQKGRLL